MAKKYENEYKVMIVGLLNSGIKPKQITEDYGLDGSMVRRWKREYAAKSGDFSKKKELSPEAEELKALRKELRSVKMERDILKKATSTFSKSDI
jgi:transposase